MVKTLSMGTNTTIRFLQGWLSPLRGNHEKIPIHTRSLLRDNSGARNDKELSTHEVETRGLDIRTNVNRNLDKTEIINESIRGVLDMLWKNKKIKAGHRHLQKTCGGLPTSDGIGHLAITTQYIFDGILLL